MKKRIIFKECDLDTAIESLEICSFIIHIRRKGKFHIAYLYEDYQIGDDADVSNAFDYCRKMYPAEKGYKETSWTTDGRVTTAFSSN